MKKLIQALQSEGFAFQYNNGIMPGVLVGKFFIEVLPSGYRVKMVFGLDEIEIGIYDLKTVIKILNGAH